MCFAAGSNLGGASSLNQNEQSDIQIADSNSSENLGTKKKILDEKYEVLETIGEGRYAK